VHAARFAIAPSVPSSGVGEHECRAQRTQDQLALALALSGTHNVTL